MASLQTFHSHVSISKLKPGSDYITLSWIENSFDYLYDSNNAFSKLVVDIGYPVSKWEVPSIDEYLNYSLRLLDFLSLVKSSLSNVSQTRVSMSCGLSLIESSVSASIKRLGSIEFKNFDLNLKLEKDVKEVYYSGKDRVIHEALMQMKKNSDLVFGITLSSLSGDMKPYLNLKNLGKYSKDFEGFPKEIGILKEFKEFNEAMREINNCSYKDVKKLETKLEAIQKHLDDLGRKADDLFSEILAGRNKVLDAFRH